MKAAQLLRELRTKGIDLKPEGDALRYRAPKSVWTPEVEAKIRAAKPEILSILNSYVDDASGHTCANGIQSSSVQTVSPDCERLRNEQHLEELELFGEIIEMFNERAAILEFEAGFSTKEAERLAQVEVAASKTYRAWHRLNNRRSPSHD